MNERRHGIGAWLTTTDHKRIGLLYICTSLAFFLVAVAFAMVMRTQLIRPGMHFLTPEQYDQVFSMHGTTMVFLFAMPMIIGVANFLVPLQIGARDMAFPRANALSYWLLLFGGLLLYSSFAFGGAMDTGWFSYAPLTSKAYSPHDGVTFWTVSLVLLGGSSILGAINFIVTCLRFRAKGMGLWQMPIFSVATFINSFLILFAFPSLTAAIALLYLDRQYGTSFFDPAGGGDPLIWQHLFWFFGHPEVYILILPAFGVMSEIVPVFSRKPLFGRGSMIVMLGIIGFLGFIVWAHHMFAAGLPTMFNVIMAGTSMLIAIPTGVKIFNWLATMWGGSLRFKTPLLFACGLIALFTIGGITGVTLAVVPFDWQVTDTYYVVAHLHNVLFAGTVFALFAGIYYWFPKMFGRTMSDRLGKAHFWLNSLGFLLTFMPMYILGFMGMPRRVYTYAPDLGWNTLNLISSIGGFIIAVSLLIFIYNFVRSARSGEVAGDNPWRAWTLEWATTSPPPPGNFTSIPVVHSERPLYDLEQAQQAAAEGGPAPEVYVLPPEPEQTTAAPFWVALALLVIAIGLLSTPIVIGIGVLFLLVVLAVWMGAGWVEPDLPAEPGHRFSFVGAGMLAFIGSEAVFFASLIAAAVHLRIHGHTLGQGSAFNATLPAINTVVLVLSGVTAHYAQVSYRKLKHGSFFLLLVLTIILGAVFLGGQAWEYTHLGFGLTANLTVSTFYTLTGFHGFHVVCGIALLVFLLVRATRERRRGTGAESPGTAAMMDAGTYYWHFVDAVWVAVFIVVYLLYGVARGPTMMRARLLAAAAFAALICLAGPVASAGAHAGLKSSDPAAGSSVPSSPTAIVLTFAEDPDASLSLLRLLDAEGATVPGTSPLKAVPGKPLELQATLTQALGQGVYTVNWRSVSAVDGHVVSGAFAFGVGVTPAPGSERTVDLVLVSPWASALAAVGRWLLYAGLALFVGAASTCLLALGGRVPAGGARLLRVAAVLAVVGLCAMTWSERALVGAQSLLPLFQAPEGLYLLALGVALLLCIGALVCVDLWPARWSLVVLGASAAAAVLVHVLAGHADAPSSWRAVNVAVQWVHMTGIGVWVGGLAWLLLGVRGMTRADRAAAVGAFSRVATVTLVVVLATGAARGLAEVGSLGNLLNTSYGITLLVKVGIVVVLVALGALNHFRWVPALKSRDDAARGFSLSSRGELVAAAAVLAATALLSGLAPASSAVASAAAPSSPGVTVSGADYATTVRAHLTVSPGAVGQNSYSVTVDGYDSGRPLPAVTGVTLDFSLPSKPSLNASTLKLVKASDGSWRGAGLQLSVGGRWHIDVVVQEAAGGVTVPLDLDVGPAGGG